MLASSSAHRGSLLAASSTPTRRERSEIISTATDARFGVIVVVVGVVALEGRNMPTKTSAAAATEEQPPRSTMRYKKVVRAQSFCACSRSRARARSAVHKHRVNYLRNLPARLASACPRPQAATTRETRPPANSNDDDEARAPRDAGYQS